jgi:hypothetical protein
VGQLVLKYSEISRKTKCTKQHLFRLSFKAIKIYHHHLEGLYSWSREEEEEEEEEEEDF